MKEVYSTTLRTSLDDHYGLYSRAEAAAWLRIHGITPHLHVERRRSRAAYAGPGSTWAASRWSVEVANRSEARALRLLPLHRQARQLSSDLRWRCYEVTGEFPRAEWPLPLEYEGWCGVYGCRSKVSEHDYALAAWQVGGEVWEAYRQLLLQNFHRCPLYLPHGIGTTYLFTPDGYEALSEKGQELLVEHDDGQWQEYLADLTKEQCELLLLDDDDDEG